MINANRKYQKLDPAGRLIEDDGDAILKDGERLVVPVTLMDGRRVFSPSLLSEVAGDETIAVPPRLGWKLSDAVVLAREALFAERKRRLAEAWKNAPATPTSPATPPSSPANPDQPAPDRETAYAKRCERLSSAWKEGK